MKIISSCKMCGFISSVLKKIIANNTTPTFQEVGGVTQPRMFCWWPSQNWLTSTLKVFLLFLFAAVFNWNEPESQHIAKPILPMRRF